MWALLLACTIGFHCDDDELLAADGTCVPAPTTDDTAEADDTAQAEDTAAPDDTGGGDDTAPVDDTGTTARVELLSPAHGAELFVGTRYDLVALVTGADAAEATVTGAGATCSSLADGVLHCAFVAETAGRVDVEVLPGAAPRRPPPPPARPRALSPGATASPWACTR